MRVVLVLALVVAPIGILPPNAASAEAAPTARIVVAPETVPADGSPFGVLVAVAGAPHALVDVKATALSGSVPLARAWTGAAWAAPTRYGPTVTLDANGSWRGAVALALREPAPAGVDVLIAVKARYTGESRAGEDSFAPAVLAAPAYAAAAPLTPAGGLAVLADASGRTVAASAAAPASPVAVAHAGPAYLTLRVLDAAGALVSESPAPPMPTLRVAEARPRADELDVENAGNATATLAGVCVRAARGAACLGGAALEPGERATVTLPLADGGGTHVEVALGSVSLDAVELPEAPRGRALVRDGAGFRVARAGATAFATGSFDAANVTPVLLPEDGFAAIADVALRAERSLDVAAYTLASPAVARLFADAASRGVAVRVLVDASPAGGFAPESRAALAALVARGVDARVSAAPFAAQHAKYVVADARLAYVASENLNTGAYAADVAGSSRGWGIALESPALAARLTAVFEADHAAAEPPRALPAPEPLPPAAAAPAAPTAAAARSRVTLALAPEDAVAPLVAAIANATATLDVQQLRIEAPWRDEPNPFLEAALSAAERGVRVRVMVDGSFDDEGNRAVVERLTGFARATGAPVEARVADASRTLHNKGVLIDGRVAVVGSLNWVRAAAYENRELYVVVDSPEVAAGFGRAFDSDWSAAAADAEGERAVPVPSALAVALAVALAAVSRPRASPTRRDRRRR